MIYLFIYYRYNAGGNVLVGPLIRCRHLIRYHYTVIRFKPDYIQII